MNCTWAEGPKTISCLSLPPLLLLPTTLSCSHQRSLFGPFSIPFLHGKCTIAYSVITLILYLGHPVET
jgi:hypothetical protein